MASRTMVTRAAIVTGALFIVEALLSPFDLLRSEIQYHGPNSLLNLALTVAAIGIYRFAKNELGRSGRVGARVVVFAAAIGGIGGLASFSFALVDAKTPGLVEGVVHTAVLLAILGLVPFAIGLRKLVSAPGVTVLVSSAALVALVLIGLDDPWIFLVPETVLGVGWVWMGATLDIPDWIRGEGVSEERTSMLAAS